MPVSDLDFVRAENPIIRDYKDLVLPDTVSPFGEEGKLPVGSFYTIDTPAGKLAKLDLDTFVPEGDASSDEVIHKIKALLQEAQPTTSALIIDMRSNGGGSIILAEGLTQLFTPNNVPDADTLPD
jgi:C-terminal processing protease CtpA/Prc